MPNVTCGTAGVKSLVTCYDRAASGYLTVFPQLKQNGPVARKSRPRLIIDLEFTGVVDEDVVVSEDTVTPKILAQLAHQHYRNEKLNEIFRKVAACIFHSYANDRD